MDPQPDLSTAIVALGSVAAGSVATVIAAIFHSRSRREQTRSDFELGADARKESWVKIQIETLQTNVDGLTQSLESTRLYYQDHIDKLHAQHREDMDRQEHQCQTRIDALEREVSRQSTMLKAYTMDLRSSGVCVEQPPHISGKSDEQD